jgi:transcriptional regulator with XRE-family HTH domain
MDQLGKRIKKKREELGLQVKELSSHIDMTPSLNSQIERGKAFSFIVTFKIISDILQTTVAGLIGEHDNFSDGDGYYFNSKQPHQLKNISGKEAGMLWIITPNNKKFYTN